MKPEFIVTIDKFEGPLDLMIHLIQENKLDLFDLDVAALTTQYIGYIKAMEELNLEIASVYLVELANLLEYKSKKLLPKEKAELDDSYEVDPDELVARLVEYKKYKEISLELDRLAKEREKMLEKPASSLIDQWISEADTRIEPLAVYHLFNAMERCHKRLAVIEPLRIQTAEKEMTIEERIEQVIFLIECLPDVFSFEALCADADSRIIVIMTFLAVLEMLKNQLLVYNIKSDTIYFRRGTAYGK